MAHSWRPRPWETVAFSRRVMMAHWHVVLVALQLVGILSCSGWPPRWSRHWACYGYVSLVVLAVARVALFAFLFFTVFKVETARKSSYPNEISYIFWLGAFNLCIKGLTVILTQVVMVLHSRDVSLLVRAVFLYLHSFPGPRHKHGCRRAAIAWFGANFAFNSIYSIIYANLFVHTWDGMFFILNDMMPDVLISATQDSFLHVVSANVDFLAAIADGVHEHVASLPRVAAAGSVRAAGAPGTACSATCPAHCGRVPVLLGEQGDARVLLHGLRTLRVRYQCVQDVVHATNWVYGWFNLLAGTATLIGGVVSLYSGVMLTITFAGVLGDYEDPLPFNAFDGASCLVLGTLLTTRLLVICAVGEQMSSENFRISSALQTGLARHPGIDLRIEREIQSFLRQTQMQEIRFGAFNLLYYDLDTIKRTIAACMTNIVILVQFSAISAQGKRREQYL
ncbi:Gustatory receptor 54 [Frankliniella occidentalis]|nr:Gustatory receptor 54 [Frankliniella occidentalis]